MTGNFREKLLKLYHDDTGRFGIKRREDEYKKMIRYGVLGQLGESHFLFLYRDLFRNSAYYGAVLFFNRPDELGNPVRVTCIEQDGSERKRDIYIKAALFFIKEDCKNSMNLSGSVLEVFEMAKEKINSFIDQQVTRHDESGNLDFDLSNRKINFREIKLPDVNKIFKNHLLKENLLKLEENRADDQAIESRQKGIPGINLKVEFQDLTGGKAIYFQPLIIPIRRDGSYGKPRKLENSNIKNYEYDFEKIPADFADFFKIFFYDSEKDAYQSAKFKIINQLYFEKIAGRIFALPDELVYCQPGNLSINREYLPLKKITFKKIEVRFAPSVKKDTEFTIFLRFTVHKNLTINARDNYEIKILGEKLYVFFLSANGDYYFAIPEEPAHFFPFFHFLSSRNEYHLSDFETVLSALRRIESKFIIVGTSLLKKYKFNLQPTPILKILKENYKEQVNNLLSGSNSASEGERLEIEFDYTGEINKFIRKNPDKEVYTYEKNAQFEAKCVNLLKHDKRLKQEIGRGDSNQSVYSYFPFRDCNYIEWLIEAGKTYLEKGFRIYSSEWKSYVGYTDSKIQVNIASGTDWLEFTPTVSDTETDRLYKIKNIDFKKQFVIDEKGTLHLVTKQEIDKLKRIARYGEYSGGIFRVPSRNYILIHELYDNRMAGIPGIQDALKTKTKLENFKKIGDYEVTPEFRGQLREYQKDGFNWLNFLRDYDFSGCLADDMGLGKTIQALALLLSLKEKKKLKTSLLVVPVSAIPNWEIEIERFTPLLTYYRHLGIKRDKDFKKWAKKDLVITSYATMRNDIDLFKDFYFDYIVLDESQNIKNYSSLVSKAARVLTGSHRLALSGTPIENNSLELWSLFDFLMPGYLGDTQWFRNQYTLPIERDGDKEKIELLKKMIYPFVMRRKKGEVEKELPEKIEILLKLRMEEEQLKLYADTALFYKKELENRIDENNVSKSAIKIFEAMLRLRQICLFPGLADKKHSHIPSAKFDYLVGLLEDILSENHKVLIFSQFVQALQNIKKHLDKKAINYSYIDGSVDVATRGKMIKAFQEEDKVGVFLLSLKAGGVALNLTAADYVIIFDPWWNPAVEAQAIDRTHRIGQTKKVIAYKMVLADSIEEKMLKLQEQKKALVEDLIASDTKTFKNLSKTDILDFFTPIN